MQFYAQQLPNGEIRPLTFDVIENKICSLSITEALQFGTKLVPSGFRRIQGESSFSREARRALRLTTLVRYNDEEKHARTNLQSRCSEAFDLCLPLHDVAQNVNSESIIVIIDLPFLGPISEISALEQECLNAARPSDEWLSVLKNISTLSQADFAIALRKEADRRFREGAFQYPGWLNDNAKWSSVVTTEYEFLRERSEQTSTAEVENAATAALASSARAVSLELEAKPKEEVVAGAGRSPLTSQYAGSVAASEALQAPVSPVSTVPTLAVSRAAT